MEVEGELGIANKIIEKGLSQVLFPVSEVSQQLKDVLHEAQLKKAEVNRQKREVLLKVSNIPKKCLSEELTQHVTALESWDFDSCVNFTDDANEAADLVWEAGLLTQNLTAVAEQVGSNILNCPTWNPQETAKCYSGNVQTLRAAIVDFKNTSMPLVKEGAKVGRQLRVDFDNCIGIPITSKEAIEDLL